ncbi:MAG: 3-deoxy-8-phosphooctulonate synthase [Planctomycetes bacterium]|nr:3-deoxy-8-phosphooctulonate synthase [Planctomycetota bacterium]
MINKIQLNNFSIRESELFFIAGPCIIESKEGCLRLAEKLKNIFQKNNVPFVFKASYDKANRTSIHSYRGPGIAKGLEILNEIKERLKIPILSDVHSAEEASMAADVLDIIQIPAFLCRQTDLILAAANTGKPVNVKKGQFLAPWDMKSVVEKIRSAGNEKIILTERGACFGYNNLVSDMRSLIIMKKFNCPVVFDATHSVQLPGGQGNMSGGDRTMVKPLARAAVATGGCNGLFLEVHENPEQALSDAATMLPLNELQSLIEQTVAIYNAVTEYKG